MGPIATADSVWQLLHRARPLNGKPLPKKRDETYRFIAIYLNTLKDRHAHHAGPYQEQEKKRRKIAEAVAVLADLLPQTTDDYCPVRIDAEHLADLPAKARAIVDEGIALGKEQVTAFKGLVAAIGEAQRRGIPLAGIESLAPRLEDETVIIRGLKEYLEKSLPNLGTGERNRFIATCMKHVTGNSALDEKKVRQRLEYTPSPGRRN